MTSGIVVNLNSEDINQMLSAAILDSALGKHINEAVNKIVNEAGKADYRGDSLVVQAVKSVIVNEIHVLVVKEYGERIREQIRAEIEKQLSPEGELVARVVYKMINDRDRY